MARLSRVRRTNLLVVAAVALLLLAASPSFAYQGSASEPDVTVSRGDGTLIVDWLAVDGADSYNVNTSDDAKNSWTRVRTGVIGTSATVNGVNNATTYYAAVQAVSGGAAGEWVNSDAAPPFATPPPAPSSVTVSRGDGELTASWPAVAGADFLPRHAQRGRGGELEPGGVRPRRDGHHY